jgi:integrase
MERWLNDSVRDSVKERTYDGYVHISHRHIIPTLSSLKLNALTPAHIQALYRAKLDAGLSNRTVRYIHQTLHRALKQAVRWGLMTSNPTEATDPPRRVRKEIKPLKREQVACLFEAARGDRLEALYVVAVLTGLRAGELLGLRWEEIDLERRVLRVQQQLVRTKRGLSFGRPKNDRGRAVKLAATAVEALRRHRKRQLEERVKAGSLWKDTGLVFTTTVGTPLDASNLTRRYLYPLLERTGLPRVRFHDLRYTFATIMLQNGENPKVVQEMLGHANISETMDTYSHILPDMQDSAVERLDQLL